MNKSQAEKDNYAKRFVKGSSLLFTVAIVSSVIALFLRIFLARTLGAAEYGIFYLVVAFISIFGFRDLGLGQAVVKYIPEFKVKKEYGNLKSSIAIYAFVQIFFLIIVSLVLVALSDEIAATVFKAPEASLVLKLLCGWFLFEALFYTFRTSFQGLQDMVPYSILGFFEIFFPFIFILVLVPIFPSAAGVALGYLIGLGTTVLVSGGLFLKRHSKIMKARVEVKKPLLKKLFAFALPVLITGLAPIIMAPMSTILLGLFWSTTEVGFYHVAIPLAGLTAIFSKAVVPVLFPMISEMWSRQRQDLIKRAMRVLIKFSFVIMVPIAFVFIAFPDVVFTLLVGSEYLAASIALQILAMNAIIWTLMTLLNSMIAGVGKPALVTIITWTMAPTTFLLSLLLIPLFGVGGAATAIFVSTIIGFGLSIFYARRLIKLTFPFSSIFRSVVGGAIALLIVWCLKATINLPALVEAVVVTVPSLFFYIVWVLWTKALGLGDLLLLKNTVPIPKWVLRVARKFIP